MTLYSDEIRALAASFDHQWPKGMIVEIVEYPENLNVRVYRDNFDSFDGEDKLHAARQIGKLIYEIRQRGCPCYAEAAKGDGRVERA